MTYLSHGLRLLLVCAALAACSVLPEPPAPATVYDFGPGPTAATAAEPQHPAIVLANISNASSQPEGSTALLYRLAYANARQLHPYTRARWSLPAVQLLQNALRQRLAQQRITLQGDERIGQQVSSPQGYIWPAVLRVELEEFSQIFSSPDSSAGLLRLNASLSQVTPVGERLIAQRSFTVQHPAPSPDAAGGAKALAQAALQASEQLAQWLEALGQ